MIFKSSPSFFLLVTAGLGLPGASATKLHHPDTNPKLQVLSGADTSGIVNWTGALRICRDYDRSLATPEEVCALRELQSLENELWIPIRKPKERNGWVRVGGGSPCQEYKDLHDSTFQGREWTQPSWGKNNAALPFDVKVVCASIPEAPPLPETCASVWGDPHITSFDGARYDVQGDGDFVLAQSLDSALDVQGRFVQTTKVSVMRGFHAWTGRDEEPNVEVNFKTNTPDDTCELEMFIDGNQLDLDQEYIAYGTYATKSTGVHFIKKGNQNRWLYFPDSGVTLHYRHKRSDRHGCQFTFKLCVPDDMKTNERFIGLLGTPNGDKTDEWMTPDGTKVPMPTERNDLRFGAAFEYSHTHYCIREATKNKFVVNRDYTCDVSYDDSLEKAVDKVSPEVKQLCGDDLECIIEGTTFEEEEGNPDGMKDSMDAIIEERMLEGGKHVQVTEDSEFEAEQPQTKPATGTPTSSPSASPSATPTKPPTANPTKSPTATPSTAPTKAQTANPTSSPTKSPTPNPSDVPADPESSSSEDAVTQPEVSESFEEEAMSLDDKNPPAPDELTPEDKTTDKAFTKGDPHFKTFGGELYDFHGECDLVLIHNPDFKDGLGMDIHIRTKIEAFWSSVESAVIKLGDDTMEIRANPEKDDWIWFNKELPADDMLEEGEWHHAELAGFLVRYKQTGPNTREANLYLKGSKEVLVMKTFKSFLRVDINHEGSDNYSNSVGLLGAHAHQGKRLGRDGKFIEDVNAFGQEWQVIPEVDGSLFHSYEGAIVGKKCTMPPTYHKGDELSLSSLRGRRLGASGLDQAAAEKACNHLVDPEEKKACVYDVIATQDLNMASTW